MNRRGFVGCMAAPLLSGAPPHRLPASDHHYKRVSSYVEDVPVPGYRWASESAYESFRALKYGVRLHWGPYSIPRWRGESWNFLKISPEEKHKYNEMFRTWNPEAFSAAGWMRLFRNAGMRMFAFTSKHHDGFSMWHTATLVKRRVNWLRQALEDCDLAYSIAETPFRRDVIRELCDAARVQGLKVDLYFSHPDWYDADFRPYNYHPLQVPSSPTLVENYAEESRRLGANKLEVPDPTPAELDRMFARHRTQLTELLTRYGRIDMLCLDQWLGPKVWPRLRENILRIRDLAPDTMFRARGIGNYGDYYTPEGFVPGSKEDTGLPWFVIHALGSSFSYEEDAAKHKGRRWILHNLIDTVAKGGNFMVGIGPDGSGAFHPEAVRQLEAAGAWLRTNGEGIFGTKPRGADEWKQGDAVRFTQSLNGRVVYAHLLSWPGESVTLETVRPRRARLLGSAGNLKVTASGERGCTVGLPASARSEPDAWVLRLDLAG